MAGKVYEIAFKVAGQLSKNFNSTFAKASKDLSGFHKSVADLERQAQNVDGLLKLKNQTASTAREYAQAREKVAKLGRELSKTKDPSRELVQEFNKAKLALERSKTALDRNRTALRRMEADTGLAGQSIKQLTERQKQLATATDRARRSAEKQANINSRLQKASETQANLSSNGMSSVGTLAAMSAAAYGSVGMPVREAIAMEDAMAEVRKVTNFTPEGLKEIQQRLEEMSTRIPLTADGLASIMAAAAQSGVAQKDLLSFTEQAAKMGVAFDITAEEAGTMMAKWQSGMGLSLDKTYELADAVNALSNVNAATAPQIGEVLKRYGALGKVAGLTEKQTAAFAASVVASGAESEVAATGIKAFMRALGKGSSMSKKQAGMFEALGLDPQQLQKQLQKDAPATIIKTLETIQKKVKPEQWNEVLSIMFGEEASVAVGPMMASLDGIKENFRLVADESKYTGSMLDEFKSRSATTSNALTLAKNAATYAARAIGTPLLDPLKKASEEFVAGAVKVGEWIKNNQALVTTGLKVAGVIAGAVASFHALRIVLWLVGSPLISVYKGVLLLRKGFLMLKGSTVVVTTATKILRGAMLALKFALKGIGWLASKALMLAWRAVCVTVTTTLKLMRGAMLLLNIALRANPIGIVITLLGALVAAGVYVYKNWDTIKAKAIELWNKFSETFPGLASVVTNAFNRTIEIVNIAKAIFGELIDFVKNVFTGQWGDAWTNVQNIFKNAFEGLKALVKAPLNALIDMVNLVLGKIGSISIDVPSWVPGVGGEKFGFTIPKIPQLATGGIATKSILANIGEGSEPEAVLPLSRLDNMLNRASTKGSNGSTISVSFAPVINLSGGSGADAYGDVKRALSEGQNNLKRELDKLLNNQKRLSYY